MQDMSPHFKKFNLGCGTIFIKDYLNVGLWNHLGESQLYANPNGVEGTYLYNHDLTHGIPAVDDSLDVIYHCHMLEHLSYEEGMVFIANCFRALKPGGILRVVVPDIEIWIYAYVNGNDFFFNEYRRCGLENDMGKYPTKGSVFMGMLHNHGHKMGYDFDTLKHVLEGAGFTRLRRTMMGDSDLPDINVVEPNAPLKQLESLCVECYKP